MKVKAIIKKILPQSVIKKIKKRIEVCYENKMRRKSQNVKSYNKSKYPYGINLIGDIRAETGLGQSMRILAQLLELGEIPFLIRQIDVPGNMEHTEKSWDDKIKTDNIYGINLIHINNSIWKRCYNQIPMVELNERYNIAYWLWELEEFPKEWISCIDTVDEIWTPAEFISRGIRKHTNKPVITMPYGMEIDMQNILGRDYFGLPKDKFLFLIMYDFYSVSERKNPRGAIDAYKKAFYKDDSGIGLVIKVNHLENNDELEILKNELIDYPNIYYIMNNLSRVEVESLIANIDVLISLHRSEGFGLPLAEAMYLGTAVVATNWSAPSEFMNEASACLVDYKLIALEEDVGPYKKGNRWADADIEQAAEYMIRLAKDKSYYEGKVQQGQMHIKECLSMEKMSDKIKNRILEICDDTCI